MVIDTLDAADKKKKKFPEGSETEEISGIPIIEPKSRATVGV